MTPNTVLLERFAQRSLDALSPLGPILHRALEPSIEDARAYFKERRPDPYLFAHLIRYHATTRILSSPLPGEVEFHSLRNSGISFTCNGCKARVWKSDGEGELHGPGVSQSRQNYFDQPFLDLVDPNPADVRYVVLWDCDAKTGLLTLTIACPKRFNEDRPWDKPECHFYTVFPHAAIAVSASPQLTNPEPLEDLELQPKQKVSEQDHD